MLLPSFTYSLLKRSMDTETTPSSKKLNEQQRPWKLWDSTRIDRRSVLASSIQDLLKKGREILGCADDENVNLVLESDGTVVRDEEYLQWLPNNTIFLVLKEGESWEMPLKWYNYKLHNDYLSSEKTKVVPDAIHETLNKLNVSQLPSFWKVVNNHGKITVVLHWDHSDIGKKKIVTTINSDNNISLNSLHHQQKPCAPRRTISNYKLCSGEVHDDETGRLKNGITSSISSSFHSHEKDITESCGGYSKLKVNGQSAKTEERIIASSSSQPCDEKSKKNTLDKVLNVLEISPNEKKAYNPSVSKKCEFHCGSLHEKGRTILSSEKAHKTCLKTKSFPQNNLHLHEEKLCGGIVPKIQLVSCLSNEIDEIQSTKTNVTVSSNIEREKVQENKEHLHIQNTEDDVDSEDGGTSEKLLFLIDQTLNDHHSHLTIFDLGVIFERLKSKIIDVHRLEREIYYEDPCSFRWNIQATIRGDVLRDLGVLYNGNYYSISEAIRREQSINCLDDDET